MDVVTIYRDKAGEWRWRRVAPNGEPISASGESFTRSADAVEGARRANMDQEYRIAYEDGTGV
jgi:uncharacterized protein YegP (UPF0339 family)